MSPFEAKKIIDALATGIDPVTGENLPSHSTCNKPEVIDALKYAGKNLCKAVRRAERAEVISSPPRKAGRSWTDAEERSLIALFDAGTPLQEIAEKFGRTHGAIASRLVHLGRIADRVDAYTVAGLRAST